MGGELVDVKMLAMFQMNWSNKLPHINPHDLCPLFYP